MQVRAVVYARISNDREGAGEGVARQIEACEERAVREGWHLVEEPLRDDSLSAWRSGVTRPAYQHLLRLVRERNGRRPSRDASAADADPSGSSRTA